MTAAHLLGVGMTPFRKAGRSLKDLTREAVEGALSDAGVEADELGAAFVGNAVGGVLTGQEMIRGQVVLAQFGLRGVPIVNVENACASGATAVHLGVQAVASGQHDLVLCLGMERLTHPTDKRIGLAAIGDALDVEARAVLEAEAGSVGCQDRSFFLDLYASWTQEYMERSGATVEHFAKVAVKAQANGARNPLAQYGGDADVAAVLASRPIVGPLTLLMCAGISDGAAAVVIGSEATARRLGGVRPRVRASVLRSGASHDRADPTSSANGRAARCAYDDAGVGPTELSAVELHDATAPGELMLYEELGLAPLGQGPRLIDDGVTSLNGALPVNPSGGLLCRGHPLGATGVAQICEASWQLRGLAGARQVPGASLVMTQNDGGWVDHDSAAAAVHIISRD